MIEGTRVVSAMKVVCCITIALLVAASIGCAGSTTPPANVAAPPVRPISRKLSDAAETIVLGDPSLLSGIPGSGPLREEELRTWLADDRNLELMRPQLPWHLQEEDSPPIPPFSRAEVEFGRQLFLDRRISSNVKNFSCVDCHHPRDHFAHAGHNRDPGVRHGRAVPPIFNRVVGRTHFWDGRSATLEDQVLQPIFNHDEMGMTAKDLIARIESIPAYREQSLRIAGEVSERAAARALAAFLRALVTGPTPIDQARKQSGLSWHDWVAEIRRGEEGTAKALPGIAEEGRRGAQLFYGEANCVACHSGPNFSDESFHALGLDAADADPDPGRARVSKLPEDQGAFKTPSLRQVAKTAPYMHRAQLLSLEEVVAFYDRGGGNTATKDPKIKPLGLTEAERSDLIAFLRLLTGSLPVFETSRLPK